jgi:SsrA-binding protein
MAKKADPERKVVADNRKARYAYAIDDTLEAGIMLTGSEVKSLRNGKATIAESYARAMDGEIFLINSYIPEYLMANRFNHEPRRPRKLLVHKREAKKLAAAVQREGMTLIPIRKVSPNSNSASPKARSCTTSARRKNSAIGRGTRRG